MNRIRQSFDGIKNIVSNVINFVAGGNDESSVSSGEIVECDSDCSECCSVVSSSVAGSKHHSHRSSRHTPGSRKSLMPADGNVVDTLASQVN